MSAQAVAWLDDADEIVVGSLFTGYGGLDRAVNDVFAALGITVRTAWVSDIDPGANRILAHRFPDVPNLGDITAVDWHAVEPVDVVVLGFPCQDLSHAGKRLGLRPDTRSGLWAFAAYAIAVLRPRLVLIENVRGLLSAEAHSDVEPCPWCVGGPDGGPALRALGAVLGDLADLGYDAEWVSARASDVGAPHGRFRVFVAAWPADPARVGRPGRGAGGPSEEVTADPGDRRAPADPDGVRPERVRGARDGRAGSPDDDRLSDVAPDPGGQRYGRREDPRGLGRLDGPDAGRARERERPREEPRDRGAPAPADPEGIGRREGRPESERVVGGSHAPVGGDAPADPDSDGRRGVGRLEPGARDTDGRDGPDGPWSAPEPSSWGAYGPAVERWATVLGRPAPAPTVVSSVWLRDRARRFDPAHPMPVGRRGSLRRFLRPEMRLSPRFVEWMMGLPDGWVTDVPDLSRNDMLKALGNGVVPQQAAHALRIILGGLTAGRAS